MRMSRRARSIPDETRQGHADARLHDCTCIFFHKSAPLGSRNCQTVGSEYAYVQVTVLVSYHEMLDCSWQSQKKKVPSPPCGGQAIYNHHFFFLCSQHKQVVQSAPLRSETNRVRCLLPARGCKDVAEARKAPKAGVAERVRAAGELRPGGRAGGRGRGRRRRAAEARGRGRGRAAGGEAGGAPPAGHVHGRRLPGPGDDLGGHWELQVRCVEVDHTRSCVCLPCLLGWYVCPLRTGGGGSPAV